MEIFSHFCDVFIQYYKIVILHFYYHTFNIALGGILYQKLPQKLQRIVCLKPSSKPTLAYKLVKMCTYNTHFLH
jgi:hypothetical protein